MSGGDQPHGPSDGKTGAVDFAYLAAQTFGDFELERELLDLFVAQARVLIPSLLHRDEKSQGETAHLLKGSAHAIGANDVAAAAQGYEQADVAHRGAESLAYQNLARAFADAEAAIAAHFSISKPSR